MRKVLIAFAVAAALCASGALKDADGNEVTAETPFGDVDGETGTVGDLVRAGGAATTGAVPTKVSQLANDAGYVTTNDLAAATDGLLRAEADPAFSAWTNGNAVAAGMGSGASRYYGTAFGFGSGALGGFSSAFGVQSVAEGANASAFGRSASAGGGRSVSAGYMSNASNDASVALGPLAASHGDGTFNVHAASPSLFYLGDSTLQSFLDAYAKPSVTNGLATKADVNTKADATNVYTKAQTDTKIADAKPDLAPYAKTADLAKYLPLTGGDITGNLIVSGQFGGYTLGVMSELTIGQEDEIIGMVSTGDGLSFFYWQNRLKMLESVLTIDNSRVMTENLVDGKLAGYATTNEIASKADAADVYTKAEVDTKIADSTSPSNAAFSNAVLSVGLSIDTNSVAVLNEIASTFGGFPIEGTATTVGGLLAALAAAIAFLKNNKADKATTLAGYGITDAATGAALDALSAKVDTANATLEEVA